MKIVNQTKNAILAENAMVADSLFSRLKGLLGRKDLPAGQALVIKPCNSVHTFFMRFPIDVLFVDKENKVIAAISALMPFSFSPIYFRASFVIELPSGTIQSTSASIGDIIHIS